MMIHVKPSSRSLSDAQLHCEHKIMSVVIGKNGVTQDKQEGDHATPVGRFPLRNVFYRADRVKKPDTILPVVALTFQDGWCDDPAHPAYNQKILLPHAARHERLWREDHVYDLIVIIGYNDEKIQAGRGSAIFMHLQREDKAPTEGCVALTEEDLRQVLADGATAIHIHALKG
ncbi:L,D-transpeptidase family protein [Acetobacter tropicalis]|nr:L,D-transpeptidase family protein [Acetobacter tropicalis]